MIRLLLSVLLLLAPITCTCSSSTFGKEQQNEYGRISDDDFVLTQDQIDTFFRNGLVTIENVLVEEEVMVLEQAFDRFISGAIEVPDKDLCDMSKPFGTPREEWSIVNAMLPTTYDPSLRGNIYERLTQRIVNQLFSGAARNKNAAAANMTKDYDQLLNKLPGKSDAVFAWHQDMGYWPGSKALNVDTTDTATFSLAIDDSDSANGCLRYVVGSGVAKTLRPHVPLMGNSRDEGHALTIAIGDEEVIELAPAKRGSLTIHDEYVVHGSGGNNSPTDNAEPTCWPTERGPLSRPNGALDLRTLTMTTLIGIRLKTANHIESRLLKQT